MGLATLWLTMLGSTMPRMRSIPPLGSLRGMSDMAAR